jgi:hypothetical protein
VIIAKITATNVTVPPKVCPAWTPSVTALFQAATGTLQEKEILSEVEIRLRRAERITRLSP